MPCSVDARRDHGRAHPRGGPTGCGASEWSAGRRLAVGECAGRSACCARGSALRQLRVGCPQPRPPAAPAAPSSSADPDRRPQAVAPTPAPPMAYGPPPAHPAAPPAPPSAYAAPAGTMAPPMAPAPTHQPVPGLAPDLRGADVGLAPENPGLMPIPEVRIAESESAAYSRISTEDEIRRDDFSLACRADDHARDARLRPAPHSRRAADRSGGRQPAGDPGHRGAHPRDDHADHVLDRHPAAAGALRGDPRAGLLLRPARGGPVPREPLQAARLARARPSG